MYVIVVGPKLRLTINKLLIAAATIQIRTFPRREKISRKTHSDHDTVNTNTDIDKYVSQYSIFQGCRL